VAASQRLRFEIEHAKAGLETLDAALVADPLAAGHLALLMQRETAR